MAVLASNPFHANLARSTVMSCNHSRWPDKCQSARIHANPVTEHHHHHQQKHHRQTQNNIHEKKKCFFWATLDLVDDVVSKR